MNTITALYADQITEFLENVIDDVSFREDYSGRGMWGKTCIGWTSDSRSFPLYMGAALAVVLGESHADALLRNAAIDSMGIGMIIYFSSWSLEEDNGS